MKTLSWREVCARRLSRSLLQEAAPPGSYATAASAMCGVQAQAPTAAEWGIGLRVANATEAAMRAAFRPRGELVRTYGLRGTVHVFPASELPLWMAAMRAHAELVGEPWYASLGLERGRGEAILAAIGDALRGRQLTREQLGEAVAAATGEWARPVMRSAWGEALAPAAFAGLLCFAGRQSGRSVYARPDEWLGHWEEYDPADALRQVVRRYVRIYGPVTHGDLARWLRVKPGQARALFADLGDELVEVAVETGTASRAERAAVLAADAGADWEAAPPTVRLLPQYDAYIIAAGQRNMVQPPEIKPRLSAAELGRFEGATGIRVVLVDGVVAGTWDRLERRAAITIRVTPFRAVSEAERELLAAEASRIALYYGEDAALEIAAVAGG